MRPRMTDSNGRTPIAPTLFQQAGKPAIGKLDGTPSRCWQGSDAGLPRDLPTR